MNKALFGVFILMVVSAIASNYFIFYHEKNYEFLVEAPCDPLTNTCFVRSCENADDCPPNQLSEYRIFTLAARDFDSCSNNSCLDECESGALSCTEIMCGQSEDDTCSTAEF